MLEIGKSARLDVPLQACRERVFSNRVDKERAEPSCVKSFRRKGDERGKMGGGRREGGGEDAGEYWTGLGAAALLANATRGVLLASGNPE